MKQNKKTQQQEPHIPSNLMMHRAVWPSSSSSSPSLQPCSFQMQTKQTYGEEVSLRCGPPKDSDCMTNHVQGRSTSSILLHPLHSAAHPQTTASLAWKKRVFAALSSQDSQLLLPFSITPLLEQIQVIALQTIWPAPSPLSNLACLRLTSRLKSLILSLYLHFNFYFLKWLIFQTVICDN